MNMSETSHYACFWWSYSVISCPYCTNSMLKIIQMYTCIYMYSLTGAKFSQSNPAICDKYWVSNENLSKYKLCTFLLLSQHQIYWLQWSLSMVKSHGTLKVHHYRQVFVIDKSKIVRNTLGEPKLFFHYWHVFDIDKFH